MARVDLKRICKRYPGVIALDDVELTVAPGEFFTLLGPSGCGKTTLLRMIAGFNRPDSGEILFDGDGIDACPPHLRNIGMVFQNYAIFPHMTRGRQRRLRPARRAACRAAEIDAPRDASARRRAARRARKRMPHELSRRTAAARGARPRAGHQPAVLLMDEPLSNLDAKLRVEMRDDIRDLQRALGITTIYVTHDQEEALVISDRICIMQGGRVHQVAAPLEVYSRPATLFVASFVGSMNVFERLPVGPGGEVTIGAVTGRCRHWRAVRKSRSRCGRRTSSSPAPERMPARRSRSTAPWTR